MDIEFSYRLNLSYDGYDNVHKFIICKLITDGVECDPRNLSPSEKDSLRMRIEENLTREEKTVLKMRKEKDSLNLLDIVKRLIGSRT